MVPDEDLAPYVGRWDDPPYLGDRGYTPHRTPRAAYAAMISRFDADVGAVLDELGRLGSESNTLVIVSYDNGPTHDVGGVDTELFDSTGGLRGRKGSLYEGGIRVPYIVRWPGRVLAGRSTDALSGFEDWVPTLIEAAGIPPLPGLYDLGLISLFEGKSPAPRPWRCREFSGYVGWQAVWKGRWKLVRSSAPPPKAGTAPHRTVRPSRRSPGDERPRGPAAGGGGGTERDPAEGTPSVGRLSARGGGRERVPALSRPRGGAQASWPRAISTMEANPAGSCSAISDSIFRFNATPALVSPSISRW